MYHFSRQLTSFACWLVASFAVWSWASRWLECKHSALKRVLTTCWLVASFWKHSALTSRVRVCKPCVRNVLSDLFRSGLLWIGALPDCVVATGFVKVYWINLLLPWLFKIGLAFGSLQPFRASPWFGLALSVPSKLRLWLTFHFVQASPSVPVFKSSVPSDFASLENLSGLHSVPSFRPFRFALLTYMLFR